jgi:hypothetical protein
MFKRNSGAEIASCILSKGRFALKLKLTTPNNSKTCSKSYWDETIDILAHHYNINNRAIISKAKDKYLSLIRYKYR